MQFWAPDDGRKDRLKHVERVREINKLWNVGSCWLQSESILAMHGAMSVKCECTFDNTFLKSLWKVLVRLDRYITVFDVSILCKLAGGVYVQQYKISLNIPIGFIEYEVRFYVPKFNAARNEFHLSSLFYTIRVGKCEERENQQDATIRCLLSTLSQHVSGIIMPIFRRPRRVLLHVVCCAGSAGCGW